jgi:YidC/Oxa1 family membrane protein insertase
MDYKQTRLFLLLAIAMIGLFLYSQWVQDSRARLPIPQENVVIGESQNTHTDIPAVASSPSATGEHSLPINQAPVTAAVPEDRLVSVETDLFKIKIDKMGGDIVYAELKEYHEAIHDKQKGFVLLSTDALRNYIAQTGMISPIGPDSPESRAVYTTEKNHYKSTDNEPLIIDLHWEKDNVHITKQIIFAPNKYLIDVKYKVQNLSDKVFAAKQYGQFRQLPVKAASSMMMGMQTYRGGAVNTLDKPYKKLPFDKLEKEPFAQTMPGGWVAMVEHYFLGAFIPEKNQTNQYYAYQKAGFAYVGSMSDISVEPKQSTSIAGQFYLGPELADQLKPIAPGLELTVDYGILWPISIVLIWVMKQLYQIIGNWGYAIIGVTLLIKLAFYKLSASSYRSMGNMRRLQPKIQALKEQMGDDKQQFGQAMMALYRKEKINPLGGCLPILVQIPVFIALYYVLLESVELRQAPFVFWLQDLSAKDPFYVLPIIMGISMFVQQKMSPAPPDPLQAKMMMFMPVLFTVLFLNFPSGLVLYWVVNNLLSMSQQWFITRQIQNATR